jgi:hypothetical protein
MESQLSYLNDAERLDAYNTIVNGCIHIWSKGQLQEDKLQEVLKTFMHLADRDPYFLAHFTSYVVTKMDSKDLKVIATFANSLSDADGMSFITGTDEEGRPIYSEKFKKPNLRLVSQAAVQELDPKLVKRVVDIANIKQPLGERYREGTHFSTSLKTAIKKYIRFREQNPKAIEGIKRAGLAPTLQNLYRALHIKPSKEAAEILGWKQGSKKKGNVEDIEKRQLLNFKGLSDLEIAEKIRAEKIPALGALAAIPGKISPVIAIAVLEQCSGNQAVILRGMFDSQGLLKNKEVLALFEEKIATAKTALDRIDKINTEVDEDVAKTMKKARASKRKKDVGDVGSIFLHIDISSSMNHAIEFAKERGAIIAECIQNPEENFHWGAFNHNGYLIERPESFEKDAFMAALYGLRSGGSTNCLACYQKARELGCTTDIYLTDQGHNQGDIDIMIEKYDKMGLPRPNAVVIVDFSYGTHNYLETAFEAFSIPVSVVKPESLTESALVTQAIRSAMVGATALIDTIMDTKLLKLPNWWGTVK